jgi:hypothetical protein
MATITVDTWEEPEHFGYRLAIIDGDELVLSERSVIRKAEATQDEVETIAYTRARDFIGPTMPCVRRAMWDDDRPRASAELAWADADLDGRTPIKIGH